MKKTNTYTINHEEQTITITSEFAKRSGTLNSDEYNQFMQFRKDLPDYKIDKRTASKNANKNTHSGLTVNFMQKVINLQENAATAQAEFKSVLAFYKGHPAYYAKVKAWFLSKYPNYDIYAPVPAPAQSEEDIPLDTPALAQNTEATPIEKNAA